MAASRSRNNNGDDPRPNGMDAKAIAKQPRSSASRSPLREWWARCVEKIWEVVHIPRNKNDEHGNHSNSISPRWTKSKGGNDDECVASSANKDVRGERLNRRYLVFGQGHTLVSRLTTQAQRPGTRDVTMATTARWPGSLQRMVRPRHLDNLHP